MKRIITTFLLLQTLFSTINAQDFKNTLEKEKLKGKVKSIEDVLYKATGSSADLQKGERRGTYNKTFDKKGNITEDKFSEKFLDNKNGKTFAYDYDRDENILKETAFESSGSVWYIYSFEYNKKGDRTKKMVEKGYGEGGYETYAYDSKRDRIEMVDHRYQSALNTYVKNVTIYKFAYDTKGRLVEKIEYKGDYESKKSNYKYDDNGNRIQHLLYYGGKLAAKYVFKYDNKKNNIEKLEFDANEKLKSRDVFKYDSKNNLVEEYIYFGDRERFSNLTKREFDSQGNWIKSVEFYAENKAESLTERSIIYY